MPKHFRINRFYRANTPRFEIDKEYEGTVRWYDEKGNPVIPISPILKIVITQYTTKPKKGETVKYKPGRIFPNVILATLVEDPSKKVSTLDFVRGSPTTVVTDMIKKEERKPKYRDADEVSSQFSRAYTSALKKYGLTEDIPIIGADIVMSNILSKYENDRELYSLFTMLGVKHPNFYKKLYSFVAKKIGHHWDYDFASWEQLCKEMFCLIDFPEDFYKMTSTVRSNLSSYFAAIIKFKQKFGLDWKAEEHALRANTLLLKIGKYKNIPCDGDVIGYVVDYENNKGYMTKLLNLTPWDDIKIEETVREIAKSSNARRIESLSTIHAGIFVETENKEDAIKLLNALHGEIIQN